MIALGIASVVTGAIGAGVQYAGAQSAAKSSETLALLNAQAQTQSITQAGQVSQMQASINTRLAQADKRAADENARAMAQGAELATQQANETIRRSRAEAARFAAGQRASLARAGFSDVTGSPLALLSDTAEKSQMEADNIRFQDEQARREAFRNVSITRNQGVLAGLNVTSQRLSGLASAQDAAARKSQARMDYYAQRANASAARSGSVGSLINSMGGLAYRGYEIKQNAPR